MHLLIAPNAFKNSLPAQEAAEALEKGIRKSKLPFTTACFPIADGGDGTGSLITKMLGGKLTNAEVEDPLGRKIQSSFGIIDKSGTVVIELADASGLRLLQKSEFNPLISSTYGTGQLIRKALDLRSSKIILCIGGSATVDGGTGIARALGIRFLNKEEKELSSIGEFESLHSIDITHADKRISQTSFVILCDVQNTLLGDNGAAAIFGPQKGASPAMVQQLEKALRQLRDVMLKITGKDMADLKHGGAAGGVAAGMNAFFNAQIVNGIEYFLDITAFDEALSKAGWLITGEGSIDHQTLEGKGPFGVARRARQRSIPVIGVAGKIPSEPDPELAAWFNLLLSINNEEDELELAMRNTYNNLVSTGEKLARIILQNSKY